MEIGTRRYINMPKIAKGSRYEYSLVDFVQIKQAGELLPIVFYQFPDIGRVSYSYHVYTQGERLDQISTKYYKKPGFWWAIAQVNPDIKDILNITPGTVIKIPNA
jgi:hypothetical protein